MEDVLLSLSDYVKSVTFITFLDFIGTLAFAISGIRLASSKNFDLFGAYIVGLTTAIGGGTVRDILLNVSPFWLTDPFYILVTVFALIFVIIFRKKLVRLTYTMFIFDTIGLALFTVVGIEKALDNGFSFWVAAAMGMITGAVGGIIRDILINEVPLIFKKEIYAIACIIGGLVYFICYQIGLPVVATQITAAASVIVCRILAVKFHIALPTLKSEDN